MAKVHFDAGRRDSAASCGWVLFAAYSDKRDWERVAQGGVYLGNVTSVHAELSGALEALRVAIACAKGRLNAEFS